MINYKNGLRLNLFSLFQIRLDNWSKIEFIFAHKLHISPLDLRELEFYTIQFILKEFEQYVERENKEYEKQNKEAEKQSKMASGPGSFKTPSFDMPKFNTPKF